MKLASWHLSGVWNFEVAFRFFEDLCTSELLDLFKEFYYIFVFHSVISSLSIMNAYHVEN